MYRYMCTYIHICIKRVLQQRSGEGDDVDLLGNGSLIKTIISPAPAFSRRPQLGDEAWWSAIAAVYGDNRYSNIVHMCIYNTIWYTV